MNTTEEPNISEKVTILKSEYNALRLAEARMDELDAAGVDNWEGYSEVDWPDEDDFDL